MLKFSTEWHTCSVLNFW